MCGIFGLVSKHVTTHNDDKFLKHATVAGAVRGLDGTGLIMVGNKKKEDDHDVTYIKRAMTGGEFVNSVWDPSIHCHATTTAVIGHNRAATIGNINDDTAHPFHEGRTVGVHNGTLRGDWKTALQVSRKCDVDSRGVFRAISARGIDWVIDNMAGAAALVWVDAPTKRIYAYRNSERPLHYVQGTNKVHFASEGGMLKWLMRKNNISCLKVEVFKTGTLYELTDGKVVELRTLTSTAQDRSNTYSSQQWGQRAAATRSTPTTLPTTATTRNTTTKNLPTTQRSSSKIYQDKGIYYRGPNVTTTELRDGIIGEYAERGISTYPCMCCGKSITDVSYYEETKNPANKMHQACVAEYRVTKSASNQLFRIVRDSALFRRSA